MNCVMVPRNTYHFRICDVAGRRVHCAVCFQLGPVNLKEYSVTILGWVKFLLTVVGVCS